MPEQNKSIKILLVEDNAYDAKIVEDLLGGAKNGRFSLRLADTLKKAAEADGQERADIALLDLNLPDSFGPETLHKAQKFMQDRPIIVMTGFYEEKLGVNLIKKGAQDYLVKGKLTGDWLVYAIKYSVERAKIELKMKERETRLRDLLEKITEGFLVLQPGGRPIFANRAAEEIFGLSHEELMGKPLPLDCEPGAPPETDLWRKDGRKVPVEVRCAEIQWGAEACRLVMVRDMTTARQLERARAEFISMASHELRAPLTIIRESLELVCDGTMGEVSEKQKEILRMGVENAGRLNRLIDALLDITKLETGVMSLYLSDSDLGGLISETVREHAKLASERGVDLRAELPAAHLDCYCDEEKLREVLMNLVSNALKFTPRGGKITLSLRPWEGQALICVENTGQGIEPEDLPKLFNKFSKVGSSSEPGVKGTGLGLAISRAITELHNGRIWAESEPGKNCRFFILLPLPGYAEAAKKLARREIEASGGKRRLCALTLLLPPEQSPAAADFIKSRFRSSSAMIRGKGGDITVFLPDAGLQEGGKAAAFIQKGLLELDPDRGGEARIIPLLYPEDFRNAEEYLAKIDETRRGQ
jgi:signal transduction histidine kinase